jgi:hypothetical protein
MLVYLHGLMKRLFQKIKPQKENKKKVSLQISNIYFGLASSIPQLYFE